MGTAPAGPNAGSARSVRKAALGRGAGSKGGAGSRRGAGWIWIGLAVALAVGALLSVFASAQPDGLERVASDRGFLSRTAERPLLRSPVADYLFPGIRNERLATGLSGFVGTLVLFAVGWLLGRVVTRSSRRTGGASGTPGRK